MAHGVDFDCDGDCDLGVSWTGRIGGVAECCTACWAHPGCKAWSWSTVATNRTRHPCWLKNTATAISKVRGRRSQPRGRGGRGDAGRGWRDDPRDGFRPHLIAACLRTTYTRPHPLNKQRIRTANGSPGAWCRHRRRRRRRRRRRCTGASPHTTQRRGATRPCQRRGGPGCWRPR